MEKFMSIMLLIFLLGNDVKAQNYDDKVGTAEQYDCAFKGFLENDQDKIPVFLHYQIDQHNVVVGEITYLHTKTKTPIPLMGYYDSTQNNLILKEYASDGNITGIISAKPSKNTFEGNWRKPMSSHTYQVRLTEQDTLIQSPSIKANLDDVYGKYSYHYGEKGYQGSLKVSKIDAHHAAFSMGSVTNAPARNIATLPADIDKKAETIRFSDDYFTYKINEKCEIEVRFYKGFVTVNYTKSADSFDCGFGHNATLQGIYYKTTSDE